MSIPTTNNTLSINPSAPTRPLSPVSNSSPTSQLSADNPTPKRRALPTPPLCRPNNSSISSKVRSSTPWRPSQALQERIEQQPYVSGLLRKCVILHSDPEYDWILQSFLQHKPAGCSIAKVTYIDNPAHTQAFEAELVNIELEAKKFLPRWSEENQLNRRKQVIEEWQALTSEYPTLEVAVEKKTMPLTAAKILFLWHGSDHVKCESICSSNFTYFGKHHFFQSLAQKGNSVSTDIGYFGSGIYFSTHADYAAMYSKGHLLFSCVSMREPFPLVSDAKPGVKCSDMEMLEGKGAYQNYNAHFIPIISIAPENPDCMVYYPCSQGQQASANELVVFQKSQTLPRFWVELTAENLRSLSLGYTFAECSAVCQAGELIGVQQWIIEDPKRLYETDKQGQTLLFFCGNQLELLKWFHQKDSELLERCRHDGNTLMHLSAAEGYSETVRWIHLQKPLLIQQKNQAGQTPLQIAAYNEQISVLELFIKEAKQQILLIVERPCHKTLDFLLKQGVNPNTANSFQQTLLYIASQKGLAENVLCLLQRGAEINAKDLSNRTALFLAVQQGHRAAMQILLQYKADLTIASVEQETVFHTAAFYGNTQILSDLLELPSCQKLINAQDHDGKTALHKAVWGSSKPDVVALLVEKGADVNAKNSYGYTPLHWAAKHGHTISAEILLKAGAKIDIVNTNQALPFDLAIRHGQDDFIRFFLQVPPKLNKEPLPSEDIEGYYYKRLLEAKKDGQVEEQILCLQIISYHYIEKNDLINGAKILNCALALLYKLSGYTHESRLSIFGQYILYRLEQIEAMFLKNKGITLTLKPLAKYRNELKGIRKICALNAKTSPIQKILADLTTQFKSLLSGLIADTQQILGKPPVKWACMGMGSMSRDEMCPYSDVEFAFLIEKESKKAMDYFRTLSQILELRIINLGETKFPIFGDSYPSPTPDGFCMDTGGNTPLGVIGVYELIGAPKTLAEFQKILWMDRSIILPNAMSHVCIVAGTESLVVDYNKEKKKVQELTDKNAKSKEKNSHVLSKRLLAGHIEEFSPNLSKEKEDTSAFGIKKELYRPFQEIIASLALIYQLKAKTTFTRIDELVTLGVFSSKGGENLKKAITQVLTLRLKAHLFYQNEEEFLCHPEVGKPLDPHLMYFDEEALKILQEIYRILIPFHRCAQEFLTSQSKEAFNHSSFYDDSSADQGAAFDENLQYANSQQARQEAVALNPNDVIALLHLGLIEGKMGKGKDALPRYFKALELAKEKYGENHPDVAISYNNIGGVYDSLGEYEKALEYYQKSLKIRLQVLGENHPDVATSHNNIGSVYDSLGEYEKALEYYQKSLKINLQVLGEDHPDVAASYNNIGIIYKTLGQYEKALEYYQKSLKIKLQVLGEDHPDVAASYNNIGSVYDSLGEYEKALEYHQKSLKIWLQVLGENHPDVATSYNNIGSVYDSLGEYEKALEYYQKSLKILLQVLGENHPDVATSYNNIGIIYKTLGEYEKALEYYQKDLKILLQVLGENHPDVATSYNNIGSVYDSLGEYEKALEYYQKDLKISLQVLGENHPDVAISYNNIGIVNYSLGEYEKALDYVRQSLEMQCKIYKKSHLEILNTLKSMIFVAKKLPTSQLGSLTQTYAICMETLGADHELVKELLQLIS